MEAGCFTQAIQRSPLHRAIRLPESVWFYVRTVAGLEPNEVVRAFVVRTYPEALCLLQQEGISAVALYAGVALPDDSVMFQMVDAVRPVLNSDRILFELAGGKALMLDTGPDGGQALSFEVVDAPLDIAALATLKRLT
jgi:hypothetical protein